MDSTHLRPNQVKAVEASLDNDFASGIHFHATGTGKSVIALHLLLEYYKRYPTNNVLWICEQKSILIEQFDRITIRAKGYTDLLRKFIILNYSQRKQKQWYHSVNSCSIWKKPILLIINRAYLVSQNNYERLRTPFHLIIHDECHSIRNKTTRAFYNYYLRQNPVTTCLGFSATPDVQFPFESIITKYSIYDSWKDSIICNPKIIWFKSKSVISYADLITLAKPYVEALPYKKIIVWCGIISHACELATQWKDSFPNFHIAIDTSKSSEEDQANVETFMKATSNAIMFCACKHREGSDIKYLDGCIFLDNVQDRTSRTFVQCIGRVLRKDPHNKKQYGLIIDANARSSIKVCDRVQMYLMEDSTCFPWNIITSSLTIESATPKASVQKKITTFELSLEEPKQKGSRMAEDIVTTEFIRQKFVRALPECSEYIDRCEFELDLLLEKNLLPYLYRAVKILELTERIPHVTRGSCGSSLVCYLLGISNVDPILHGIEFARFLNRFRDTLPDIDFDFPHICRDEIFMTLNSHWPGQVARISNHVHFHEKSAKREAIRQLGYHKRIGKRDLDLEIEKLPKYEQDQIHKISKELENTFRCYSLHCGGIIFFENGIPEDLKHEKTKYKVISQVIWDKRDIAQTGSEKFKIDILSSRGLTQLYQCLNYPKTIDFNAYNGKLDSKIVALFAAGDNIGVTLFESPLVRKTIMRFKPDTLDDIAMCLAIIRPAAKRAKEFKEETQMPLDAKTDNIIYDDDAISLIRRLLKCDGDTADKYRRVFAKGNKEMVSEFEKELVAAHPDLDQDQIDAIKQSLSDLRQYGFCKAHAYSYAQLVAGLAYQKVYNVRAFWRAALDHCHSSYRRWVHIHEAAQHNVSCLDEDAKSSAVSIYAKARRNKIVDMSIKKQFASHSYWVGKEFYPGCYLRKRDGDDGKSECEFRGIIASSRLLSSSKKNRKTILFVGYDTGRYIEVIAHGFAQRSLGDVPVGIQGTGEICNDYSVTTDNFWYF